MTKIRIFAHTETMAREAAGFFLDKTRIRHVVADQNKKMGFAADPRVTTEEAQEAVQQSLQENGLRPEDNIFSCSIIAAREEQRS